MRRLLTAVAGVLLCAGCGPTVDLTQGLKVNVIKTGWYDMGIVNGQNRLVPMVTFTLKNVSERRLDSAEADRNGRDRVGDQSDRERRIDDDRDALVGQAHAAIAPTRLLRRPSAFALRASADFKPAVALRASEGGSGASQ